MATNPAHDKYRLPLIHKNQILEDLERLGKNQGLETQLSKSLASIDQMDELLKLPSDETISETEPKKPANVADAVSSAVKLIHLDRQLNQRGTEIENRQIGLRLENNRRKIDHLLRTLSQPDLLASSNSTSPTFPP